MAAFWLFDAAGLSQVVGLAFMFLSGAFVPIVLFPGWLEAVARASPFAYTLQVPVELLLGKYEGDGVLAALGLQAAWAAVLLGAGRLAMSAATRRVVVQGG